MIRTPKQIVMICVGIVLLLVVIACSSSTKVPAQSTPVPTNPPSPDIPEDTLPGPPAGQQILVDYPDTHKIGPSVVVRYALTDPTGMDIYPLGDGHIALYAIYDTGSTKVRISNASVNHLTNTNWGKSDVDHLKITGVPTVNLRLNGLQEEDSNGNVPIGPPGSEYSPQVDIGNISVKPDVVDVTLIGAPVANQVVAHLNFSNKIIGLYSGIPTMEVNLYIPGDANIPAMEIWLPLEQMGGLASADATAGYRYWIKNLTFENNGNSASDNDGLNFLFDTGTTITIVNDAIAQRLGLPSQQPKFDCLDGTNNGYFIDSVKMAGAEGTYLINNASVCWDQDAIKTGDAVIGTNFFDTVQMLVDGPRALLGISK